MDQGFEDLAAPLWVLIIIKIPKGPRTQIIGLSGPNTILLALKPDYLGPWTLRENYQVRTVNEDPTICGPPFFH